MHPATTVTGLAFLALAACEVPYSELATAEYAEPGVYGGAVVLEVRAMLGPVRLDRATCEGPATARIDPAANVLVLAEGSCELPGYDDVELVMHGWEVDMPEVAGTVESDAVRGTWQGWFLDPDHLVGVAEGSTPYQGLRLDWESELEVTWAAPLGGGVGG